MICSVNRSLTTVAGADDSWTVGERNRAVHWDGQTESGEECSFGAYFYQIEADGYTETHKMVIPK